MPIKTPSTLSRHEACVRCRNRKVKCDARRPGCTACRRSASHKNLDPEEVVCEYAEPTPRRRRKSNLKSSLSRQKAGEKEEAAVVGDDDTPHLSVGARRSHVSTLHPPVLPPTPPPTFSLPQRPHFASSVRSDDTRSSSTGTGSGTTPSPVLMSTAPGVPVVAAPQPFVWGPAAGWVPAAHGTLHQAVPFVYQDPIALSDSPLSSPDVGNAGGGVAQPSRSSSFGSFGLPDAAIPSFSPVPRPEGVPAAGPGPHGTIVDWTVLPSPRPSTVDWSSHHSSRQSSVDWRSFPAPHQPGFDWGPPRQPPQPGSVDWGALHSPLSLASVAPPVSLPLDDLSGGFSPSFISQPHPALQPQFLQMPWGPAQAHDANP